MLFTLGELILYRTWQMRIFIMTDEVISLAKEDDGQEILIDAIPLEEIVSVRDMNVISGDGAEGSDQKSAKQQQPGFRL